MSIISKHPIGYTEELKSIVEIGNQATAKRYNNRNVLVQKILNKRRENPEYSGEESKVRSLSPDGDPSNNCHDSKNKKIDYEIQIVRDLDEFHTNVLGFSMYMYDRIMDT